MTQNRYLVSLFVLVVLVMASLACNAGAATPTEEVMVATEQPTVEPASETPVEPTADTAIAAEPACPTPTDGTLLYRSDEFGYCFLYPATYTLNPDWNIYEYGVTGVYGTPLDPTAMESLAVSVEVFYNGPAADVSTANEYASKWVQVSGILPEDGSFETSSLGGNDAVIVIGQPGMFSQQTAYAVVDGRKYSVTLTPTIGLIPDLVDEGQTTWDLITGSIVFFPPTSTHAFVQPGDVCPTASPGNSLHVNELDGMCFLVPDGWTRDLSIGGSTFTTGQVLGQMEGFGDIVPRFSLAFHGSQGSSLDEVMQPFVDNGVDPATYKEFTAGGYPGVEYAIPSGPYGQRGAMILADRGSYSVVANPYDPNMFAESIPVIDMMWDTALNSLQFFSPWR